VVDGYQYRELIEWPWRLAYRLELDAVLITVVLGQNTHPRRGTMKSAAATWICLRCQFRSA
jgi:hypothetical protein